MLILLLLGLLLAFLLQRIIYEKNWKKRLDVTLKFQDSWIYEGEKSALKEVVKNDNLLPGQPSFYECCIKVGSQERKRIRIVFLQSLHISLFPDLGV